MKELPRAKKLEVAQYYILGHSYGNIEGETGVSHGSVVNIIKELEDGKLDIPGSSFDQINDLRQLSLDLKKKDLSTSQALLGLSLFQRAHSSGILPEHLDQWAQLVNKFTTTDFPASDFLDVAIRFHQLEMSEGKAFEVLADEYKKVKEDSAQLKAETSSLEEKRKKHSEEMVSISSQLEVIKRTKGKLEADVESLVTKLKELKSEVGERQAENSRLGKEVQELKQQKIKLSSEVDNKEAALNRLNDIGFLDEDLIRLRNILDRIAEEKGSSQKEVKEGFFIALGLYKDITELKDRQEVEAEKLRQLTIEKSVLTNEIARLESQRDILQSQIKDTASAVTQEITEVGQKAVLELQKQIEDIKGRLDGLVAEALRVAGVVGEMKAMVRKGEESEKSLKSFIEEITTRSGVNG